MTKYVFLLGGQDLEMLEIQKLLEQHEQIYYNEGLNWSNASWKAYQHIIDENQDDKVVFVGIELRDKDKRPANSLDIDHHNGRKEYPSSIEQVARLLCIDLTDWQKKVAVNDKGAIRALLEIRADESELEKIRAEDRKIQGVTEDDMKLARQSVENNLLEKGGFVIIQSLTDKFSAVSDILYFEKNKLPQKLIIYNDDEVLYSGIHIDRLTGSYQNAINKGLAYYGGAGKYGYFGWTKAFWADKDMQKEIEKIQNIINKKDNKIKEMYSYHVFMFPFRWKIWNSEDDKLVSKFSLGTFEAYLTNTDWKRKPYNLDHAKSYNEYNYFYDFVREVLFDLGRDLKTESSKLNNKLIRHFEYDPANISLQDNKPLYYEISVNATTYKLEVDSIILNMYGTGVGVLSFHLRNRLYDKADDILQINKFGRRLYPPYMHLEDEGVHTGIEIEQAFNRLKFVTDNELPYSIRLVKDGKTFRDTREDFVKYFNNDYIKHGPFQLPAFITKLFPDKFFLTHEQEGCYDFDKENANCKQKNGNYKVYLRPALNDDRMYVVSWYANDELSGNLKRVKYDFKKNYYKREPVHYFYAESDFWHNYIFIDTSRMFDNKLKLPDFVEQHTYSRWVDSGTLYGISRYSLVMLTGKSVPAFLIRHLQSMYYKMAELSLIQRATVVSFSDEVTHVSDLVHSNEEKAIEKIEELYKYYILFVNKIYFREVTPQEQGIEMYDMMQRIMRIPEQVKDLDDEIAELNDFAGMIADKNERKEMKTHTVLATIFLPAMAIAGLLGMNTMASEFKEEAKSTENLFSLAHDKPFMMSLAIIIVFTMLFWMGYKLKNKNAKIGFYTSLAWLAMLICFLHYLYLC